MRTKVSEGRSRTPADRRCTSPEHTEECLVSPAGLLELPRQERPLKIQGLGEQAGLRFLESPEHPNPHSMIRVLRPLPLMGRGRRQLRDR